MSESIIVRYVIWSDSSGHPDLTITLHSHHRIIMKPMRVFGFFFCLFTVSIISACDSSQPESGEVILYDYTASDSSGTQFAIRGMMRLRVGAGEESSFSGSWDFSKVGAPGDVGPQVGNGELRGNVIRSDSVRIDLNPQADDQKVILAGRFTEEPFSFRIKGKWMYQRSPGTTTGRFTAEKVSPSEPE